MELRKAGGGENPCWGLERCGFCFSRTEKTIARERVTECIPAGEVTEQRKGEGQVELWGREGS